ncbi:hypothetical protein Nmel_018290 [Mimus melanotis]
MDSVLLLHGLLLLPLAALLLYKCSPPFQYLCKVAFFNCWIVASATLLSPFAAFRGRSVENMRGAAAWPSLVQTRSPLVSLLTPSLTPSLIPSRLLRAALLPLKRFYGIRMRVRGSEQLQLQGPFVIVCNHQASLDLMVWGVGFFCGQSHGVGKVLMDVIRAPGMVEVIPERCVPIAKRELLYLGTVGWACWLSGTIFIDRHRRDAAIDVISRTASTMRRENVPIVPIVISPYWDFFSSKEKRFTSGTCTIRVLPRVETQGLSPKDVPKLTESVWQAMAEALAEMSMSDHEDQDMEQPLLGLGKDRGSPQGQGDTARNSN